MATSKLGVLRGLSGSTLSSQIVAQIKEALFKGDFVPGDPIGSEAEIAAQFGVSRMSVRDALRTLEAIGVIEIRVGFGGGARIANGSQKHFTDALAVQLALLKLSPEDILQAQAAIETVAAGLCATNASDEHIAEMRALLVEAEQSVDDPVKVADLGHQFHLAIAVGSGNSILVSQLEAFRHVMWPPSSSRTQKKVGGHVVEVHRRILDAIEARDAMAARREMADHVAMLLRKTPNHRLTEKEIQACCAGSDEPEAAAAQ